MVLLLQPSPPNPSTLEQQHVCVFVTQVWPLLHPAQWCLLAVFAGHHWWPGPHLRLAGVQ